MLGWLVSRSKSSKLLADLSEVSSEVSWTFQKFEDVTHADAATSPWPSVILVLSDCCKSSSDFVTLMDIRKQCYIHSSLFILCTAHGNRVHLFVDDCQGRLDGDPSDRKTWNNFVGSLHSSIVDLSQPLLFQAFLSSLKTSDMDEFVTDCINECEKNPDINANLTHKDILLLKQYYLSFNDEMESLKQFSLSVCKSLISRLLVSKQQKSKHELSTMTILSASSTSAVSTPTVDAAGTDTEDIDTSVMDAAGGSFPLIETESKLMEEHKDEDDDEDDRKPSSQLDLPKMPFVYTLGVMDQLNHKDNSSSLIQSWIQSSTSITATDTRYVPEPFLIRTVEMREEVSSLTKEERREKLASVDYQPFKLRAKDIELDLFTDSGICSLSTRQKSAMECGDESYAGSESYHRLKQWVRENLGFEWMIPVHQGRGAEKVLCEALITQKDSHIPSNHCFFTTGINIALKQATVHNFECPESDHLFEWADFKGNMDCDALEQWLKEHTKGKKRSEWRIPFGMMVITLDDQPASMQNIRRVSQIYRQFQVPFVMDACRFAENAWFIKQREPGYSDKTISEIIYEMFSLCDGCYISAKKDGMSNIGGILCANIRDDGYITKEMIDRMESVLFAIEGFVTYGGLAGRDLESMRTGFSEVMSGDSLLSYRMGQTRYLQGRLNELGIPLVEPCGGGSIIVDVGSLLPHIPRDRLPAQTLVTELYIEGGVRTMEKGSVCFGESDPETGEDTFIPKFDLLRIALPRRTLTQAHLDHVVDTFARVLARSKSLKGMTYLKKPPRGRLTIATFKMV